MKTIGKPELIKAIATGAGISHAAADKALQALVGEVVTQAQIGNKVRITGLGAFEVRETAARQGRNPKTGETVTIAAGRKLAFRAQKGAV